MELLSAVGRKAHLKLDTKISFSKMHTRFYQNTYIRMFMAAVFILAPGVENTQKSINSRMGRSIHNTK